MDLQLSLTSSLTSTPLVLQESLTSSRNHRMCPCFPTSLSISSVLLLVLQGLWRCCGGSVGPKWENLNHLHPFFSSQVRKPSGAPVHHGKYVIISSVQTSVYWYSVTLSWRHTHTLFVSPPVSHLVSPPGVNETLKFYCEAKNTRGISVSRTGTVHIKGVFAVTITSVAMVACKPSHFSVEILTLVWHDAIVSCLAWQNLNVLAENANKQLFLWTTSTRPVC